MLHYKKYDTYEDYVEDQVAKLRLREDYVRQKSLRKFSEFYTDFARFAEYFKRGCRILCLGARFGDEVRAFRKLGYDAIGIDLWGDEGDLVIKGDWNNLPFENEFDIIYTNSIDHASSIETLIEQIKKALKSAGKVIIDLNQSHTRAGNDDMIKKKFDNPERYEAMLWNRNEDVIDAFCKDGFSPFKSWIERKWHTYMLVLNV